MSAPPYRRVFFPVVAATIAAFGCQGTGVTTMDVGGADSASVQPDTAHAADDGTGVNASTTPDTSTNESDMEADPDVSVPSDLGPDLLEDVGSDAGPIGSAGCIDGEGLPEGENTFVLEDRDRRFIVRLPNGYSSDQPWPLVFALHGNGGSASYWDGTSGGRNIRGVLQDDAILVVAEAIDGRWRDYDADPSTWPARIESELLYFDEIITLAQSELCIDENAMFSMGFSGGGSFSGVLGCRRTDIRAIAVGGSVIYFDEADCVGTPAAWITIGTNELSGAREEYRDFFRDRAGCEATTSDTEPSPCIAYDNCGDGTPVHYCQHPGGHIWPDFGSQAMWDFFQQFVASSP